jgi:hypothetical protein
MAAARGADYSKQDKLEDSNESHKAEVRSRKTVSLRLSDYAHCLKSLHKVLLLCIKCKCVDYCSKDCQVCAITPCLSVFSASRPFDNETGMHAPDSRACESGHMHNICTECQGTPLAHTFYFSLEPARLLFCFSRARTNKSHHHQCACDVRENSRCH